MRMRIEYLVSYVDLGETETQTGDVGNGYSLPSIKP